LRAGLGNKLIRPDIAKVRSEGAIRCRERLSKLLRYHTDENDLRKAILKTQEYLETTLLQRKVVPFAKNSGKDLD